MGSLGRVGKIIVRRLFSRTFRLGIEIRGRSFAMGGTRCPEVSIHGVHHRQVSASFMYVKFPYPTHVLGWVVGQYNLLTPSVQLVEPQDDDGSCYATLSHRDRFEHYSTARHLPNPKRSHHQPLLLTALRFKIQPVKHMY